MLQRAKIRRITQSFVRCCILYMLYIMVAVRWCVIMRPLYTSLSFMSMVSWSINCFACSIGANGTNGYGFVTYSRDPTRVISVPFVGQCGYGGLYQESQAVRDSYRCRIGLVELVGSIRSRSRVHVHWCWRWFYDYISTVVRTTTSRTCGCVQYGDDCTVTVSTCTPCVFLCMLSPRMADGSSVLLSTAWLMLFCRFSSIPNLWSISFV